MIDEHGFSIHEIIAEAGLHPEASGGEKVPTTDGHAYWVNSDAIVVGDITKVWTGKSQDGRTLIWVRLGPTGREAIARFSSAHVGRQLACVLNGRIVGAPGLVSGPITSGELAISTNADPTVSRNLAADLAKTVPKIDERI